MKEEWFKHPSKILLYQKESTNEDDGSRNKLTLHNCCHHQQIQMKRPQFNPTFHETIRWKQNVEINPTIHNLSACWYSSLHFTSPRIAARQDPTFLITPDQVRHKIHQVSPNKPWTWFLPSNHVVVWIRSLLVMLELIDNTFINLFGGLYFSPLVLLCFNTTTKLRKP